MLSMIHFSDLLAESWEAFKILGRNIQISQTFLDIFFTDFSTQLQALLTNGLGGKIVVESAAS